MSRHGAAEYSVGFGGGIGVWMVGGLDNGIIILRRYRRGLAIYVAQVV